MITLTLTWKLRNPCLMFQYLLIKQLFGCLFAFGVDNSMRVQTLLIAYTES